MFKLYRETESLVGHAHRTLDEGERTLAAAKAEMRRVREQVAVAAVFAYVAALASVMTFIVLDRHVKQMRNTGA